MQTKNYNDFVDDFDDQGVDFRRYIKILRKHWLIILSIVGIAFFVTVIFTYTTQPIYSAFSQVLIERNTGKSTLESNYYSYDPDFLETQAEIIKSENVARKVVGNLQLATAYKEHFIKESRNGKPSEKEASQSNLETKLKDFKEAVGSFFSDPKNKNTTHDNQKEIPVEPKTDEEIIAEMVRGGLNVVPVKNTKIVNISYQDKSPAIAKLVADAVVKAYMDEMLEIKLSTSNYSLKWMTAKAAEERDKLERLERQLQEFMRENDLVTVENRLTILPQKLSEFGGQLSKAEAQKKEMQDLLDQIKSTQKNPEALEKLPVFASDGVLKAIRERIYKAEQNIQELSKKYGNKHPVMIRAMDELRLLKSERKFEIDRIVSATENSYQLALSKNKSLENLLDTTKSETLDLNEKFVQYSIMKREVDSNRVLYDTLQTNIKQQGVTEQSQSVNIWVIKKASLPGAPTKPNKKKNLVIGFILGLAGGIGLALFIEYLDNTLNNVQQIEERFGLTVLGSIEEVKGKDKSIDSFILYNPLSPLAESYRLIRSALLLSAAEHPPKVTLITSMSKSEGKTATVTNLARMLVQDKRSVLIIDCDLRRPRMHSLLNMPNDIGLSSYLAGNVDECTILSVPDEGIALIPSGPIPPNPSELLGSEKMKKLISDLAARFQFLLLDSPPIGAVTDSLTLSQFVDGTILVVKAGSTTIEMFEAGVKKMRDVHARILGVVLNGVKSREQDAYQYGYTTYYAKDDD
jgi:capsular exopolysaccharide synthesis family protein